MTWPDVLRWLALIVGSAASLAGLAWTLGRLLRPWMRNEVREGIDMLYARLKNNDFQHVEDRIDRGLAEARADREAMETRLRESAAVMESRIGDRIDLMGGRIDRMGGRMEGMEARILAAVRHLEHPDKTESGT